jgi:hypothetical protein
MDVRMMYEGRSPGVLCRAITAIGSGMVNTT